MMMIFYDVYRNVIENESEGAAWETLVLFAVNFERLNVHMNMGNVMGNVRSVSIFTVALLLKVDWTLFSFFFLY